MKLQFTVDDALGNQLQEKAHDLGFSVSSYVRHLIKKSLDKSLPNELDMALDDIKNGRVEKIGLEDFKKQLDELS